MKYLLSAIVMCTCSASLFAAEVAELSGKKYSGELVSLNEQEAVIQTGDETTAIDVEQLMQIDWKVPVTPSADDQTLALSLVDQSQLSGESAICNGLQVTYQSNVWGQLQIPLVNVKALRFQPLDEGVAEQWSKLLEKQVADDMLVIKKNGVLDFLGGVVTEYSQEEVKFLYQGSEIPVRREKVFGIIHPRRAAAVPEAGCEVRTMNGDRLMARSVRLNGDELNVHTGPEQSITLPLSVVSKLDYSMGRIAYLTDLTPESTEYTPFFDTIWEVQRNRTNDGSPLRLGNTEYASGLWIHSRTRLTYRLAGEYTRFQAIAGIDQGVARTGHGNVQLTIKADDKVLFDQLVTALDSPQDLDFDVTNARFLTIFVDFGEGLDIGDHLDLVEAKLIK